MLCFYLFPDLAKKLIYVKNCQRWGVGPLLVSKQSRPCFPRFHLFFFFFFLPNAFGIMILISRQNVPNGERVYKQSMTRVWLVIIVSCFVVSQMYFTLLKKEIFFAINSPKILL